MSPNTDRFSPITVSRNGAGVLENPERPMLPRTHESHPRHESPRGHERPPRLGRLLLLALLILAAAFVIGIIPRLRQHAAVAAETRDLSIPSVTLVSPTPAKAPPLLQLSGELKAAIEAPIYARATGYVRKWNVDIGSHVEPGQVMAELEIPEIDQQLAQAQADLKHAQAARELADLTASRWQQMLAGKTVSRQDADEKQADVSLTRTAEDSAKANVQRLDQMVGFAKITAPFAGTVTARSLDIGQLVNAGSGLELFRVALTDKLRVFVRVPQSYAHSITPQQNAEITLPDLPGRKFPAKIVRTAGAMDAASRTLLTELEVDNAKGELYAGGYAQVRLSDASAIAALTVPSNTLLFRPDGPVVAILGADHHVALRPVTLGRDFGFAIELLDGVKLTDQIVINPPDSLVDGVEVRVSEAKAGS
jgi:membrane fusion protein, multidrug efflux system